MSDVGPSCLPHKSFEVSTSLEDMRTIIDRYCKDRQLYDLVTKPAVIDNLRLIDDGWLTTQLLALIKTTTLDRLTPHHIFYVEVYIAGPVNDTSRQSVCHIVVSSRPSGEKTDKTMLLQPLFPWEMIETIEELGQLLMSEGTPPQS